MKKKTYEKHLHELQTKLSKLQDWVKATGYRGIIIFEGRDAAGKGGAIKALTERLSPRVFPVVALPAPSDRQKSQWYLQRYVERFPAAGEIVIFDRSWYNRAGVEIVMDFCTPDQRDRFLELCPRFEQQLVRDGINLVKYWLEVSNKKQEKRFEDRINNPVKKWKLSDMDLEARRRWYDYSLARDIMFEATDTDENPWHIVKADDRRSARLNCISHLLNMIPYKDIDGKKVELPPRSMQHAYDDEATMAGRRYVPDQF